MASLTREFIIDAAPEAVWEVVGDFAAGPLRALPGFFIDCQMDEPEVRALTLADGTVVRERLVGRDDRARRIVWAWLGDEVMHDNTSMQVLPEGPAKSRVVWIHDTLPDTLSDPLAAAMDEAVGVIQRSLGSSTTPDQAGR